ncbi:hypothetical protein L195_g059560 [Trifolium pratense]|uniref:Uncharacterized protein n=1 Tax=Trifolium pratense TaxID=57577 RepID=A0A2K3JYW0_TRIPR|nr:hypothetical protein L195_g059560 [Trifolium pratense]
MPRVEMRLVAIAKSSEFVIMVVTLRGKEESGTDKKKKKNTVSKKLFGIHKLQYDDAPPSELGPQLPNDSASDKFSFPLVVCFMIFFIICIY